jgi:CubicO group peptidase (beta-lactamase class C family)
MTRRFLLVVLVAAAASAQNITPPPDAAARVKQIFARFDNATGPGCAVGVSINDQPALTAAYGMADLEHDVPNRPDTVFEAGSVSKQFTAMAVLLLMKDGKLSLDDNVRKYIPELPEYQAPITIRHLLNHTSGLRDWGSLEAIAGWPRTTRAYTHDHVLEILSRQKALNYKPGDRYSYTNSGYNLAAILVTRVSGQPFAQFCKERIFQPLGMTSTQWRDDFRRVVKNRAIAYMQSGSAFRQLMPFEDVHGNGGLLTTVGDLLKWNANVATAKVGGKDIIAMQQVQSRLNDGEIISYALGLFVQDYRGAREISHSGTTAGYNAWLGRYPDQGVSVAVLCNGSTANGTSLGRGVASTFLGDALKPSLQVPGDRALGGGSPTQPEAAKYAGTYYSDEIETTLQVVFENGKLVMHRRPNDTIPLTQRHYDEFTGGGMTVRFIGNELSLHESRVWDLRFQRR